MAAQVGNDREEIMKPFGLAQGGQVQNDREEIMKVAIVHDYIKEYGGAERVLEALCEIFPEAPIYTAFYKKDSIAYQKFKDKKIIASWVQNIPFFATKLHSPLRFLAPFIWGSFDFSKYDVVISSASWYVTKGFGRRDISSHPELGSGSDSGQARMTGRLFRSARNDEEGEIPKQVRNDDKKKKPIEICYCHTPPRWLYGYKTSVEWQKFWPIKVYGTIIGHFMRLYDFNAAQKVDYFIANSEEVKQRIKKFYRREAIVIYPPVELPAHPVIPARCFEEASPLGGKAGIQKKTWIPNQVGNDKKKIQDENGEEGYYFIVSRIVGSKGLDLAVEAATKLGFKLKIAGATSGYYTEHKKLAESAKDNVEFLGFVTDEELVSLYANTKAFLALAEDEDFGITPVEAMSCGTPVIAYNGGGYKETVIEGKTGVFFNEHSVESLISAIKKFEKISIKSEDCIKQAQKFSKEEFKRKIKDFVEKLP
ncbi:MAG: glycosyltransferase [Candidatus Levybacteria bacterium]|nr:glycosyltransferase [Candidatus Levybacteria bacterium]